MSGDRDAETDIATRESWKTLPIPEARAELRFSQTYDLADFERIKRGLIPEAMEDKWFIFFEEPWLYLHRSWTGACIYGVRFQPGEGGFTAVESWVSRDPQQYKEDSIDYDRAVLGFLIDRMLLGRPVPFPVRSDLPAGTPEGVYQHHIVGRAYPEREFRVAQPKRSVWSWLKGLWGTRSTP
ncbi:MAG TPA: hypothetical protein VF789_29730 [Thermoanaerobaculia bacterium]